MKNALAIAALCLVWLFLTAGRQASKASVEDQVKKQEQSWAEAVDERLGLTDDGRDVESAAGNAG